VIARPTWGEEAVVVLRDGNLPLICGHGFESCCSSGDLVYRSREELNELVVARAWMDDVLECFDGLVPFATHLWLRGLREVCLFIIDS